MGIFGRREAKASRVGRLMTVEALGRPVWTPRDYASLAQEGFSKNPIVFRAVRTIAEAAQASAELALRQHQFHRLGTANVARHVLGFQR